MAIREFLNLSSTNQVLNNVPFFYLSDHDIFGFDIYHVIKFGSRATSWASPSLVCSKLQWAGPTEACLEKSIESQVKGMHAILREDRSVNSGPGAQ